MKGYLYKQSGGKLDKTGSLGNAMAKWDKRFFTLLQVVSQPETALRAGHIERTQATQMNNALLSNTSVSSYAIICLAQ